MTGSDVPPTLSSERIAALFAGAPRPIEPRRWNGELKTGQGYRQMFVGACRLILDDPAHRDDHELRAWAAIKQAEMRRRQGDPQHLDEALGALGMAKNILREKLQSHERYPRIFGAYGFESMRLKFAGGLYADAIVDGQDQIASGLLSPLDAALVQYQINLYTFYGHMVDKVDQVKYHQACDALAESARAIATVDADQGAAWQFSADEWIAVGNYYFLGEKPSDDMVKDFEERAQALGPDYSDSVVIIRAISLVASDPGQAISILETLSNGADVDKKATALFVKGEAAMNKSNEDGAEDGAIETLNRLLKEQKSWLGGHLAAYQASLMIENWQSP